MKLMANMVTRKQKGKARREGGLYLFLRFKRERIVNLSSII